ncbi:unnamed protein product, partial [Notodromas monacha]
MKEEINKRLAAAGANSEENISGLRRHEESTKTLVKFKELSYRQDGLEEDLEETRQDLEKSIAEESQERQKFAQITDAKVEDMNDRMRQGLGALQAAIGAGGVKLNAQQNRDLEEAAGSQLSNMHDMHKKSVE